MKQVAQNYKSGELSVLDVPAPACRPGGVLVQSRFSLISTGTEMMKLTEAKLSMVGKARARPDQVRKVLDTVSQQGPVATYKKGHRHGPGAHVIILSGSGYSLMWPEGEEPQRFEWQTGSLIIPPNMWFHQHFNTSPDPARYLAFKHESVSIRNAQGVPKAWISRRIGGDQIDYADERPEIRDMFAEALAQAEITPQMDQAYQAELPDLPPVPDGRLTTAL